MIALGLAIAFVIIVTLAYFGGKEVGREESDVDRYCSRIDEQIDYEEAQRRREESDRGET